MRKRRVVVDGAVYHVTCRCNNKEALFDTAEKRDKFVSVLAAAKRKYGFELWQYIVMPNHVHLLLTPHHEHPARPVLRIIKDVGGKIGADVGRDEDIDTLARPGTRDIEVAGSEVAGNDVVCRAITDINGNGATAPTPIENARGDDVGASDISADGMTNGDIIYNIIAAGATAAATGHANDDDGCTANATRH